MKEEVSISIISILISQLGLNVWKSSLHASCCNFWGLEGKYIAAQICFSFCKGACSSFVWKMT